MSSDCYPVTLCPAMLASTMMEVTTPLTPSRKESFTRFCQTTFLSPSC